MSDMAYVRVSNDNGPRTVSQKAKIFFHRNVVFAIAGHPIYENTDGGTQFNLWVIVGEWLET